MAQGNDPAHADTVYEFLQAWWGEPLSQELAIRIARAPLQQLRLFAEDYEYVVNSFEAPELAPGNLRPALRYSFQDELVGRPAGEVPIDVALRILLYSHEILIDDPLSSIDFENRTELKNSIRVLLHMQPLAAVGLVHFAQIHSRARHPSGTGGHVDFAEDFAKEHHPELERLLLRVRQAGIEIDLIGIARVVSLQAFGSVALSRTWAQRVQPFARSQIEAIALKSILDETATSTPDLRGIHLQKLAAMDVPSLQANVQDLIAIRRNSEEFAEWRTALASALTQVQDLREGEEQWAEEAADIVHSELSLVRERLRREARRSSALASMRMGTASFAISGLGALAGAATGGGQPLPALMGAGSAKAVETVANYIRNVREVRRGRALLNIAMLFSEDQKPGVD